MARWTDATLGRLADQVQANIEAINRLEAKVEANAEAIHRLEAQVAANAEAIRELREAQALMMQVIQRQENRIEELRQDTRNIHADIRQLLAILTRNYPNGRQDVE
ncbi:MAG: hypothetical protein RMI89_07205 [Gloeomargarita sp. SKYBB_i_bin120]|nr:hypothetical protein [Gloeomargarita sp. SKYB120]MDW8178309.1 hypothetical protein [Gloeomargarita sp. SKYBB_i_bin120]